MCVLKLISSIVEGLYSPVHVNEEHKGKKWCAVPVCPQDL